MFRFRPGHRILVVEGSARGCVGVVLGSSPHRWPAEHVWRVRLDESPERESHMREGVLVPEPEKSDTDLLGPLRRMTCP